jgi:hypothetical protein
VTRIVVGNLRDGRRITDVPFVAYKWELARNQAGIIRASIPMYAPEVAALDLRASATPGKAFLAIVEDSDYIPNAGKLGEPEYDWDNLTLNFSASGIWSHLYKRSILPSTARTIDPALFVVADPSDSTKTIANPALATVVSGVDLGSVGATWVRQALAWPGGELPIVVPGDVAGVHTKTVQGVDLKPVGEGLADLTTLEGGPDIAFDPRLQADRRGVEWLMRVGSETQPELRSNTVHRFDLSVSQPSTRRLQVIFKTDRMASIGWASGGGASDSVLIARSTDTFLTDAGYPLQEAVDSSRRSVIDRDEMASYANDLTRSGRTAGEFWSFQARKDAPPYLGEYAIGDRCKLIIRNDPYIRDGDYIREIAALAGDQGDWVTITIGEV